jgi:hypothetical protein
MFKLEKFKRTAVVAVTASILGAASFGTAHAASIGNFLVPGSNGLQDVDFDRVLRCTSTDGCASLSDYTVVTSTDFAKGDILQAVLRFDTINGLSDELGTYGLFAYSELMVDAPGGTLNFVASPFLGASGAMVSLFEQDPTALGGLSFATQNPDLTISQIQAMSFVASFGKVEADDFWKATVTSASGSGQIGDLALLGSGAIGLLPIQASGSFGLSVITDSVGLGIINNGEFTLSNGGSFHAITGEVGAFKKTATQTNPGWIVETDTKAFFQRVPEPGSLALLGLAMFGAGFVTKRKARKQD